MRVRIGRYGPFLQLGEGGTGQDRVDCRRPLAPGGSRRVEKAMALIRAKAEGPRSLGVDPTNGMNVYAIHGRFGAYVAARRDAGEGQQGKAEAFVARPGSMTESTVTLDEALKLPGTAARTRRAPGRSGQPVVAGLGRFRPVHQAWRRLSLARADRRSVHRRSRARPRAACGAEAAPRVRRRSGSSGRSRCRTAGPHCKCSRAATVLHVTDGETQRLDSEGRGSGDDCRSRTRRRCSKRGAARRRARPAAAVVPAPRVVAARRPRRDAGANEWT